MGGRGLIFGPGPKIGTGPGQGSAWKMGERDHLGSLPGAGKANWGHLERGPGRNRQRDCRVCLRLQEGWSSVVASVDQVLDVAERLWMRRSGYVSWLSEVGIAGVA